jgi:hypothetical protein
MAHDAVKDAPLMSVIIHAELDKMSQKGPLCETPKASASRMPVVSVANVCLPTIARHKGRYEAPLRRGGLLDENV